MSIAGVGAEFCCRCGQTRWNLVPQAEDGSLRSFCKVCFYPSECQKFRCVLHLDDCALLEAETRLAEVYRIFCVAAVLADVARFSSDGPATQ